MDLERRPFHSGPSLAPDGKSFRIHQVDSSDTDNRRPPPVSPIAQKVPSHG